MLLKRIRLALWTLRANKALIEELYDCIDYDPSTTPNEKIKLFSKYIRYAKDCRVGLEQFVKQQQK